MKENFCGNAKVRNLYIICKLKYLYTCNWFAFDMSNVIYVITSAFHNLLFNIALLRRGLSVYFRSHNEWQCRPGTSTRSYFAVRGDTQHSGRVIQGIVDRHMIAHHISRNFAQSSYNT